MLDVDWLSVVKLDGGCGIVSAIGIVAPLPSSDVIESPIELNATTRISTEAKSARFQPGFLRVVTGIVQVVAEIIVLSVVASQLVES